MYSCIAVVVAARDWFGSVRFGLVYIDLIWFGLVWLPAWGVVEYESVVLLVVVSVVVAGDGVGVGGGGWRETRESVEGGGWRGTRGGGGGMVTAGGLRLSSKVAKGVVSTATRARRRGGILLRHPFNDVEKAFRRCTRWSARGACRPFWRDTERDTPADAGSLALSRPAVDRTGQARERLFAANNFFTVRAHWLR